MVQRRITYRLYPTRKQEEILHSWRVKHAELYNAALEERRTAWRMARKSVDYHDQQDQLPALKKERPDLIPLGSHALQETVRRVDRAFQGFFRRVKKGEKPGYPRWKKWNDFKGWTWPDPAGWKLHWVPGMRTAMLEIPTLGTIRARGKAGFYGDPVTCTITTKRGIWEASVVVDCEVSRMGGPLATGLDWGVSSLLTFHDGRTVPHPRFLEKSLGDLEAAQKALSRKEKGSRNRLKAKAKVGRLHRQVANLRKDYLHKLTAELVGKSSLIATEKLSVKGMVEDDHAAALNRGILDAAPAAMLSMLRYKAEEAGIAYLEAPTRELRPSQRCPGCWKLCGKKPLWQRKHVCPYCGLECERDRAAALVCLQWALGQEQTPTGPGTGLDCGGGRGLLSSRQETPRLAQSASG